MNELNDGTILIRQIAPNDTEAHLAGEDAEMAKWLSGGKSTLESVKKWIEKTQKDWEDGKVFVFAVVELNTNNLVGMVEGNTEYEKFEAFQEGDVNITYGLYPAARGKGYASRAVSLLLKFLKEKNFKRAIIRIKPENSESLRVPKRLGFEEKESIEDKGEAFRIFIKEI